eukprot:TRINITY_DN550_c0_g1_i8.p2 TRINITY_DN550_c0_g1~~TRINITY_DN550_c0_g1_i8.p2  ORF type:complete len:136 (-),score=18.58 TRINITY_DN550_c0_g1_i8:217-624(-)
MKSVFGKTQCLKKGDQRSYVHELRRTKEETAEDLKRYYRSKAIELGNLRVEWVNSFGEVNHHYTPTIFGRYNEAMEKFYIRLVEPPENLYVDEPQLINLKISNVSPTPLRLKLTVNEGESKTMVIIAVSQSVVSH